MGYCCFTGKRPGMNCIFSDTNYCIGKECRVFRECSIETNKEIISKLEEQKKELESRIFKYNEEICEMEIHGKNK